ncbi:hypothetical protein JHK82_033667 [Glycine max]|nr:hypothetical protein JHK82_033667 [Glycine max]
MVLYQVLSVFGILQDEVDPMVSIMKEDRIGVKFAKSAVTIPAVWNIQVNTPSLQEHLPVLYPEVVLSVERFTIMFERIQELLILGGQTLTALRDKIFCSTNQVMHKVGQHDPSSYFLIEDVLCPDLRDPSTIDLTRPILDWLRDSKEEAQKKWEYIITEELQKKQKVIMGEKFAS